MVSERNLIATASPRAGVFFDVSRLAPRRREYFEYLPPSAIFVELRPSSPGHPEIANIKSGGLSMD